MNKANSKQLADTINRLYRVSSLTRLAEIASGELKADLSGDEANSLGAINDVLMMLGEMVSASINDCERVERGFAGAMGSGFESALSSAQVEVWRIETLFESFQRHRRAWEAVRDARGDLIKNHPDAKMTVVVARELAAFPVTTAEGMRAKARAVLSSDLMYSDIFESGEDVHVAFLRSIAGDTADQKAAAA